MNCLIINLLKNALIMVFMVNLFIKADFYEAMSA